jgi:peptidyl-prolyl cis-trans isomerase SurA
MTRGATHRFLLGGSAALTIAAAAILGARAQDAAPEEAQPRPQVGTAVAAVVNDAPISTFDVEQRVRLMMATSGAQLTEDAFLQMQAQALRDLVEEQLKLQEAERFELVVSEEQVDEELARIAATGGGTVEALVQDLAMQGISVETLRTRIRADTAWEQLVGGRYGNRVSISEDEIEDQMRTLRAQTQEEQFLVSEICLPIEDQSQVRQMQEAGMQLIGQMRRGVPFAALAQQFSACPSAARGGDLGWMTATDLHPSVAAAVSQLQEGNVSTPLPADDMLIMVALRQKRAAAEAGEPSYEVAYAGAPKSVGAEAAAAAFEKLPQSNACGSETLSTDLGPGVGVTGLPMLPASAFQPAFRPVLDGLERGEVSGLLESEGAYHAVIMCQKDEGLGLPSRTQVAGRLRAQELERLSRRYLRDVERDSAVDVRLGSDG